MSVDIRVDRPTVGTQDFSNKIFYRTDFQTPGNVVGPRDRAFRRFLAAKTAYSIVICPVQILLEYDNIIVRVWKRKKKDI